MPNIICCYYTVNEEVYVVYGVVGFLLLFVSGVILVSVAVIYLKGYARRRSMFSDGHVYDEPNLPEPIIYEKVGDVNLIANECYVTQKETKNERITMNPAYQSVTIHS